MKVSLVSITQSVLQGVNLSPEELIVYVARVSNPSNQLNTATSEKLIRYCIKHKHWSPFEMVDMTVEIKTSRAISAQILRHRSFSFQEFSQRYSDVTDFEPIQLRKQAEKNRQSSLEVFNPEILGNDAETLTKYAVNYCESVYQALIKAGVARECARMVLPLTTQTTLYMKGSVRSYIHYLQLRLKEDTQLEHREVAQSIEAIFSHQFPVIYKAIKEL